jgi:trehalose-6-phosphatase
MEFKEGDRVYKIINKNIDLSTIYKISQILSYNINSYDGYFIEIKAIAINENTNNEEEILVLFCCHLQNYYEKFLIKL